MRKIIYGVLAIVLILQTSCNKDDNSNPDYSLLGSWKFKEKCDDMGVQCRCDEFNRIMLFSDNKAVLEIFTDYEEESEQEDLCKTSSLEGKWEPITPDHKPTEYKITYNDENDSEQKANITLREDNLFSIEYRRNENYNCHIYECIACI